MNDHQINDNCFNEPFAVSPCKSLYWDMHGLIFETSIWLLAGSTRLLVVNQSGNLAKSRGSETLTELMLINCASCCKNATLRSEEFFSHTSNTAINAYSEDLPKQGTFTVKASISDAVLQAIKPQHIYWCKETMNSSDVQIQIPKTLHEVPDQRSAHVMSK